MCKTLNSHWKDDAGAPILWPPDEKSQHIRKDPDAGKDWQQEEKGTAEDEMVEWHHRLSGHEFEQTPETMDRGACGCTESTELQRVRQDLATEQQ